MYTAPVTVPLHNYQNNKTSTLFGYLIFNIILILKISNNNFLFDTITTLWNCQFFYQNQSSIKTTWPGLRARYNPDAPSTEQRINIVVKKFESIFTLLDIPRRNRASNMINTSINVEASFQSFQDIPNLFIGCRFQQLHFTYKIRFVYHTKFNWSKNFNSMIIVLALTWCLGGSTFQWRSIFSSFL